jgi:hypothetical protein
MATFTPLPPDQVFLAYLGHAERVALHACRQQGFDREEAEEFISTVKCKLIEDDYAIVRKFQGRSSFKTYLTVVVQWLFLEYRRNKDAVLLNPKHRQIRD